jgi:hypothetical protein
LQARLPGPDVRPRREPARPAHQFEGILAPPPCHRETGEPNVAGGDDLHFAPALASPHALFEEAFGVVELVALVEHLGHGNVRRAAHRCLSVLLLLRHLQAPLCQLRGLVEAT